MKKLKYSIGIPLVLLLTALGAVAVAQLPRVSMRNLMTVNEFKSAGLHKLTSEELKALDTWLLRTLVTLQRTAGDVGSSGVSGTYPIEASVNDETFIVNSEVFKARTYCFNIKKGDRVKFIDGSAFGACASAKFINMRTGEICEVWCE